jgi:hypothetical protein
MSDSNVHQTSPNEREDLEHTDTLTTDAGMNGTPGASQGDAPIGVRVERDPSNLGNDIPEAGDLTHPSPVNQPLGKMPGM